MKYKFSRIISMGPGKNAKKPAKCDSDGGTSENEVTLGFKNKQPVVRRLCDNQHHDKSAILPLMNCKDMIIKTDANGRKYVYQNGVKREMRVINVKNLPIKKNTNWPIVSDTKKIVISKTLIDGKAKKVIPMTKLTNSICTINGKLTDDKSRLNCSKTVEIMCQTDCLDRKDNCTQTDYFGGISPIPDNWIDSDWLDHCDRYSMNGVQEVPQNRLQQRQQQSITREEMVKWSFFNDLKDCLQFDRSGNLPIHDSVMQNNVQMVRKDCVILSARRQTPNIKNFQFYTPLHLALLSNVNRQIIEILLLHGSDITKTDNDGNSAIHLAVEHNRKELLKVLLEHAMIKKIPLDHFNYEGVTPLMIACYNKFYEIALLLLEYGASPNLRDKKSGKTALFHAAESHDASIVHLLVSYRADTKIRNFFGTSPHDAMFEVDSMPSKIKAIILGKEHLRHQTRKKPEKIDHQEHPKIKMQPVLKRISLSTTNNEETKKLKKA